MKDDDYLFDPTGEPDPETRELEQALAPLRYSPRDPRERRARSQKPERERGISRRGTAAVIAALALAAGTFAVVQGMHAWSKAPIASSTPLPSPSASSLEVSKVAGAPRVGERPVDGSARLDVGAWLVTDDASRAEITLADIGRVRVEPRSRVRLVTTAPNEQRLELAQGAIDAKVIAPPRLFVVDTPSARATDLGCAYRLEVAADGGGVLRVASGAVELEGNGHSAWVPAGAACETHPRRGPGSPYFEDALDALTEALRRFDADPDHAPPGTIEAILSASRPRDTLTLWHLQARTKGEQRALVAARIQVLVPSAKDGGSLDDLVTHW